MRSVHQFAPWVRHIWLVTDAQRPAWLAEHDRVTVVDHRELWADPSVLPVFNSHAIESQLHRIPGLAEHYVYMNDDVFLARMLRPATFFSPGGLMRIHPSPVHIGLGSRADDDRPVSAAGKNDRTVLLEALGRIQTHRLLHTGQAQRRSLAADLAARYPGHYERTAAARFRSPEDISPVSLQSWYALGAGWAVADRVAARYIDLAWPDATDRISSLRREQLDFVCLNQTEATGEHVRAEVLAHLARAYPFRAPWETAS
jgi:hypothetical protein